MRNKVNINGQELELEQCVIEGDELEIKEIVGLTDNYESYIYGDSIYYTPNDDSLDNLSKLEVVEVPEDEQFIKEYIEYDLSSQPIDKAFEDLLHSVEVQESMPLMDTYPEWLWKYKNNVDNQNNIDEYTNVYVSFYRGKLRDWWFKRRENNGK